jgi:hypothetical protein
MHPPRALLLCLLAACSGPSGSWSPVAADKLSAAQEKQQQRAVAAKEMMFQELMGKLQQALAADGPAGAIGVCKDLAPQLAETVSRRQSLRIGRTSDKLRNSANSAPAWAAEPLRMRPTAPTFLVGPAGELGALLPIRVLAPCLACHGPTTAIDPPVQEQLHKLYPDDRATGYALNDLRGWFWVEVPPQ